MAPDVVLLTTSEVAETFRVSESTVRRWEESGDLRPIVLPGRGLRRFRLEDVEAMLRNESPTAAGSAA